jgi:glutathione S-transferase
MLRHVLFDMSLFDGEHDRENSQKRVLWLLEELGVPYEVKRYERDAATMLAPSSLRTVHPLGKSPVVTDGDLTLAESGAIVEYLAEKFPDRGVWPQDLGARTRARSVCAEMHAGFSALRNSMQMNCELRVVMNPVDRAVRSDIARITDIWASCRRQFSRIIFRLSPLFTEPNSQIVSRKSARGF